MLRGVKLDTRALAKSVTPAWRARVGTYVNADPGDDEIAIERARLSLSPHDEGVLLLDLEITRYPRPLSEALRVIDDDEAVTAGYGRHMGETVRVRPDGALVISGYPMVPAR